MLTIGMRSVTELVVRCIECEVELGCKGDVEYINN